MRFFLALWPGERERRALAQVAQSLAELASGKAVPPEKIHLTLAFLGEIAPERMASVREAAGEIRGKSFELVLDGVGSFRKARVAWAGSSVLPAGLARLQADLEARLRAREFTLDERPFAAHVTLVRKIAHPVPAAPMPPIRWSADAFVLVRSETGTGRYSIVESWSLERD
jgi:2'-5' RNA ligase